jgi:indolepyruvate ferredoxin oxidoreductase
MLKLQVDNAETRLPIALDIARIPETIKGFGHVKEKNVVSARFKWDSLMREISVS